MPRKTISVTGMSCDGCEQSVEDALNDVEGVSSADADHEGEAVDVEVDEEVRDAELAAAVEDAGYKVV